jgi:hypothetical protein
MAYTQTDVDRLETAIAQGVMSVTFSDGRSVTFSSFEELSARLDFVKRQMGVAHTGTQRLLARYRKGVSP